MAENLLQPIGALEEIWAPGKKLNYVNHYRRKKSGISGVAQNLLQPIGALEGIWALGKK